MLGRFLIIVAMMLFGPLFVEVYLYHPIIVMEHDAIVVVPGVVCALAVGAGFLFLAVETRITAAILAIACGIAIFVGVVGTAFHLAIHASAIADLATDARLWLGGPPILVPLTFAAAGCLGLIPLAAPRPAQPARPAPLLSRILEGIAALAGLVAAIAASQVHEGALALFAVFAALGLGTFGYAAELVDFLYPIVWMWWRSRKSARPVAL